jgi:hypothetical protein
MLNKVLVFNKLEGGLQRKVGPQPLLTQRAGCQRRHTPRTLY